MIIGAQKFSYAGDLAGISNPSNVMEFDIATDTVVVAGQMVTLSAGKVIVVTSLTAPVLGMAAESHDGATEGRDKGTRIRVHASPTAIYKCRPYCLSTADSGNTTTWVDAEFATVADDVLTGGYLKLKKTTAITNKSIEGLLPITDFATTTGTFTGVFTGGVTAGDQALAFPPVGAYTFALTSDMTNLDLKTGAKTAFSVVRVDLENEYVYVSPRLHVFANVPVATA